MVRLSAPLCSGCVAKRCLKECVVARLAISDTYDRIAYCTLKRFFMQVVLDHVSTVLPVISFPLSLGVINVVQWVTRMQGKIHYRIAEGIPETCGIYCLDR